MELLTEISTRLQGNANTLGDYIIGLLVTLSAVGLVSMAFIEVIKALFARPLFNFSMFYFYIRDLKQRTLIQDLCIGGGPFTFYTMKAEQLIERLKRIAEFLVNYPVENNSEIIRALVQYKKNGLSKETKAAISDALALINKPAGDVSIKELDDAREFLLNILNSSLDGFKLRLTHFWELLLKALAIIISTLLIYIFLPDVLGTGQGVLISVIGGMVAPVAHNILSQVSGRRQSL